MRAAKSDVFTGKEAFSFDDVTANVCKVQFGVNFCIKTLLLLPL